MGLSQLPAIQVSPGVRYFAAIFLATFFFFFTRQETTGTEPTTTPNPAPQSTKKQNTAPTKRATKKR